MAQDDHEAEDANEAKDDDRAEDDDCPSCDAQNRVIGVPCGTLQGRTNASWGFELA